ncbi:MAG: ABC transporter permease [Mycoplasmatales bacterium]
MGKFFKYTFVVLVFIFIYLPIIYIIGYSFNSGGTMAAFDGFSLANYSALMENTRILEATLNTIIIAVISSYIAMLIGTAISIAIVEQKSIRHQNSLLAVNRIMFINPDIVIGVSLLLLFTFIGIEFGLLTVLIAHVVFNVPVVVITVLNRMKNIKPNVINAAYDLGATKTMLYRKVILPQIKDVFLLSFTLSVVYSIDDFIVSFFVTGNGFSTLPIEIYAMARQGVSLELNALFTIFYVLVFTIMIAKYLYGKFRVGGKDA